MSTDARAVPVTVTLVDGPAGAETLAQHLLDEHRARPAVVVTTAAGQSSPYIDLDDIESAVSGLADVYLVVTGSSTFALSALLPARTDVYGGAGRVYPVDRAWQTDPYAAPLRFVWNIAQGPEATDRLIADALGAAHAAGLISMQTASAPVIAKKARGRVAQLYPPSWALVDLSPGIAAIWQELLVPGVELERTLAVGMSVEGQLNDDGRLDVSSSLQKPSAAMAGYVVGEVILVRVALVDDIAATVELFPGVRAQLSSKDVTGNPLDRLTSLISADEILAVRVAARGGHDGRRWRLSMLDVDDDETPLAAPSLLPGGPSWLVPPALPSAPLEAPTPAPEAESEQEPRAEPEQGSRPEPKLQPAPDDRADTADPAPISTGDQPRDREAGALRDEIRSLQLELTSVIGEATRAHAQIEEQRRAADAARTSLRREKVRAQRLEKQLRSARSEEGARAGVDGLFTDPELQFRFEVEQAYAYRIPASDKDHRPKRTFTLGPDFLASLDTVGGVDRSKVVDVTVEVITDLVNDLPGREVHRLRQGSGGDAAYLVRHSDSAQCMRASLQVNTPSARRLHYWKAGASIELSSVRLHDDMRP